MKTKASDRDRNAGDTLAGLLQARLDSQFQEDRQSNLGVGGLHIIQHVQAMDCLSSLQQTVLEWFLANTGPVARVQDPYARTGTAYVVIAIDPCSPVIREVAEGTANSYPTLVDAKEAARQILQSALERASKSLAELRQLGVDRIGYISL